MRKKQFRLRFTFWLDMLSIEEQSLAEYIEELKASRKFVQTVRDGLRLLRDLRAGKVDVLFQLFPWVKAEFMAGVLQKTDNGSHELMRREFEELKSLILSSTPLPAPAPKMILGGGPKMISAPKFEVAKYDDDEDMLVLGKDTTTDSAMNFLNSMLNLQH